MSDSEEFQSERMSKFAYKVLEGLTTLSCYIPNGDLVLFGRAANQAQTGVNALAYAGFITRLNSLEYDLASTA